MGGSAKKIMGVGDDLVTQVGAFRSATESLTSAFGDDDLGSALGMIYQVVSEVAFESFQDSAETLSDIGDRLGLMAENYIATDTGNKDVFHEILGGLA
ncbi:hypothetical protein D5S17_03830 [Pseudonocardiaceae bacterium YIM PH 21723]|nr:hypothetical protein D5S17_03830 [Pseudonocardiaceae bacterium YIM PH 21723]